MHRSPGVRAGLAALIAFVMVVAVACSADDADDAAGGSSGGSADATTETTGGGNATGELVSTDWQKVLAPPSCHCSDGSPFHYWVRRGDPGKVLFYLEGGGACFSAETCASDTATYTVNIEGDGGPGDGGIFDLENDENPLADHSMIYVPYCTGDLHLGDAVTDYSDDVTVHHNGYTNASTALAAAGALFPDATEVVVAGSSAGSAGAPGFGGGAHDVWPDADVAVIADGSAAYPGTPEITLTIGGLWGVDEGIPLWPETADLPAEAWSLHGLFTNSATHFPEIRFASFNDAYDEVQAAFAALIGLDGSNLVDLIDDTNESISDTGVDLSTWVSPGTEHTILGKPDLYDEEVDGQRFVEWLTDFLAGDDVDDVHCDDCEPPA
ncbi:MAG: hypothetical protein GX643_08275 [Acidimicrobiales bacterium]|nr:hypothetical protein [Acidimicrobiales bacterium]